MQLLRDLLTLFAAAILLAGIANIGRARERRRVKAMRRGTR